MIISVKNTFLTLLIISLFLNQLFNSASAYSAESAINDSVDFDLTILDEVDGIINSIFKSFVPGGSVPSLNGLNLPQGVPKVSQASQKASSGNEDIGDILFEILKLFINLFATVLYIVIEILKAISLYLNKK